MVFKGMRERTRAGDEVTNSEPFLNHAITGPKPGDPKAKTKGRVYQLDATQKPKEGPELSVEKRRPKKGRWICI